MARQPRQPKPPPPSDDEIRQVMLQFFYDRNKTARSRYGKKTGSAVTESVLRRELKASHGFTAQQATSNLTYLLSQGWIEERPLEKRVQTPSGAIIPATTTYYVITAAGIDKLMGPSKFTRDRFQGIKIEATGQNIITLGDGNQIDAKFQRIGEELSEFKKVIRSSPLGETDKVNVIVDIESIEVQLAKPEPNKAAIASLWEGIMRIVAAAGLIDYTTKILPYIQRLI